MAHQRPCPRLCQVRRGPRRRRAARPGRRHGRAVTAVTRQARRAAAEEFAAAWHELHAVYEQEKAAAKREGRHVQETPAYWAANNRVAKAEQHVPWWRRW